MILTIRTDKPEAEIGLYIEDGNRLAYKTWHAHRELSETIHLVIKELLSECGNDWSGLTGIIFFKGPGSFTGLRIGAAVANALSVSEDIPLTATSGNDWIKEGIYRLKEHKYTPAYPEYGADPHITQQKK